MHQEICDFGKALVSRVHKQRIDAFFGGFFAGACAALLCTLL
jgi:hypothetical protein